MDKIKTIEEILLNSMPSLQTVLLDGWVLRFNKNYTYRENCVCPLYYNADIEKTKRKIAICEEIYDRNELPTVFKVTPIIQKDLASILLDMDYEKIKTVYIMNGDLKNMTIGKAPTGIVLCAADNPEDWLNASSRLSGLTDNKLISIHVQEITNIAVKHIFIKAVFDGKVVGCGYGTVERGYVGIYGLHVDRAYRKKGIGTSICGAIFKFGRNNGAENTYLAVNSANKNAISLYSHMGFAKLYEYNFYQKTDSKYKIIDA